MGVCCCPAAHVSLSYCCHCCTDATSALLSLLYCCHCRTAVLQGGHFAAWEQPQLLYEDVMAFVSKIKL
jgi:hypothetical protein